MKAKQAAIDLEIQIKVDHVDAIMHNRVFDFERAEEAQKQVERDEQMKAEAIEQAVMNAERDAVSAEKKRLKDIEIAIYEEKAKALRKKQVEAEEKVFKPL